jgi:hypothetical protein
VTTGEKDFEEFYTDNETLDMDRFVIWNHQK